jgi:hypothetical protein
MNKKFPIEIVCRMNGRVPSIRDKWNAFYCIWRAAGGKDRASNSYDAFLILCAPGSLLDTFRKCVRARPDCIHLSKHQPKELRRRLIEYKIQKLIQNGRYTRTLK